SVIGGRLKSGSVTVVVLIWIFPENGIGSGAFAVTVPLTRIVWVEVTGAATAGPSPQNRPPTTATTKNNRTELSNERRMVIVIPPLKAPSAECRQAVETLHPAASGSASATV